MLRFLKRAVFYALLFAPCLAQFISSESNPAKQFTQGDLPPQSAHAFYRDLQGRVRAGIEATGPLHWFERLLGQLGHELWIGDSAKIRASEVRKQKTDERDALLILELLLANCFPKIWVPTPADRDLRQFLKGPRDLINARLLR